MINIEALPLNLLIARQLGARIEGYFQPWPGKVDPDDHWMPISDFMHLDWRTELRCHSDDLEILKIAQEFVDKNFFILSYKDYKFQVPNRGREVGCIRIPYGFGVFVDADGNELGKNYLITIDYKGPIPEEQEMATAIRKSGLFVEAKRFEWPQK